MGNFDDELGGEDVGELRTVAVASTGGLLKVIVIVIVAVSKQVATNEFGDLNGYGIAVEDMVFSLALMVTLKAAMERSRCLLSPVLTRISSKIL